MGLFDNLFKPKSPPSEEKSVETGAKPAEPAKHSDAAARAASERPDPSAFLHPKSFVPRGVSPLTAPPPPKSGVASAARKAPAPALPSGPEQIVLTLGDVLSRIPTPYLRAGNHDPKRELRFGINDLSSDIARGRAAVRLSRIAELVPDIFVKQISRDEDMEVRLPLQKLVEQIGLLRSRPDRARQGVGSPSPALPGHFALAVGDAAAPGRETLRDLGSLVEPVFELKSVETADLAVSVEEEPVVELKPTAEPLIVQFPLTAGAPEVATPPDLAEEDTTDPEPEVAEPVPSPTKEVAATARAEETPAKVSESFEALMARLEKEAAAKFSEESSTHADKPPAVAKETTRPAAESVVPTVESTAPPTEHAVDAKPDQPLAEKTKPVTEPPPVRSEALPAAAEPILPKAEAALLEPVKPAEKAAVAGAEPVTPVAESAAPSTVSAPSLVERVANDAASAPPPIAAATTSPGPALPAVESSVPVVTPEAVPVAASTPVVPPAPVGELLPSAVPVMEKVAQPEMAGDVPAKSPAEGMLPAARVAVPERPVIPSPAVKETTEPAEAGGEKIQLSLAAILKQCPREIIVGEMPHVPDSVRITLPFAPIDRQLVQGHVEISAVRFVAAIPFTYQKHFSARMGVKVPIPLEEVFQNLPSAVPNEPAATAPSGPILAPAFPEENVLAAIEKLPPPPDMIELAPAVSATAIPKVEPTGIESVMAMLKAEFPPPIWDATELPKGVEMPPLEKEAPKGVEAPTDKKAGRPAKAVEPATIEGVKPVSVELPPLPQATETPQGVTMPPIKGAMESPKGVTPPLDKQAEQGTKAVEPSSIEVSKPVVVAPPPVSRVIEAPQGTAMPPLESAAEAPKAAAPLPDRKGEERPKAVESVSVEVSKPAVVVPPPALRAVETPHGVVLPPLESAAEAPKAVAPLPDKKTEEKTKPVEPVAIEMSKPFVVPPPPIQWIAEAPQGTAMPPLESATEGPKGIKPLISEQMAETAKPAEPPVESTAASPIAPEPPPPHEGATEAPKAIKPTRIKKATEGPKAVKPAATKEAEAKPEAVQPPRVEGAALAPQAAGHVPVESAATPRAESESRPTESAASAVPQAESPQRVEESSSSPVSSETPQAATAPGAPPMEPTSPQPAPSPLDLPAFHQFMPPPPVIVPEAVEPAPITAIGSAEPLAEARGVEHLAPAPGVAEAGRIPGGSTPPAAAVPSVVVPGTMAAGLVPEPKGPSTGPEPHEVARESVPQITSMSPESQPSVRSPEPASDAPAPEVVAAPVANVPLPPPPPPAPPVDPAPAARTLETPEGPVLGGEVKKTEPATELKAAEEPAAPAAPAGQPSMSVFAEATHTIRPPQIVRPFIVLPPPILGFTAPAETAPDDKLQGVEDKDKKTELTSVSEKEAVLSGGAGGAAEVHVPEVSSIPPEPPKVDVAAEPAARVEEGLASPKAVTIDVTPAVVKPVESIPSDEIPAVEIDAVPAPKPEAPAEPVLEVIPPARKEAPEMPAAEKPAASAPAGLTFVAHGHFAPPPSIAPAPGESIRESVPETEPVPAAPAEPAPAAASAAVPDSVVVPAEPVAPVAEPVTIPAEPAAAVAEPVVPVIETPAPAPSEKAPVLEEEPLLQIPKIAAALEAAAETEVLPPPALPLRRFDQDALQALFMTEETLDLSKISRLAAQLPGVHACVIATRDQACTGGTLPEGFDLAALLGLAPRVNEAAGRMPIGNLKHFTLYGERYSISFFARNGLSLCAVHRPRSFVPGVREKLVAIADELSK